MNTLNRVYIFFGLLLISACGGGGGGGGSDSDSGMGYGSGSSNTAPVITNSTFKFLELENLLIFDTVSLYFFNTTESP